MTTQLVPTPQTCTNVTKDDRIWKRESPISDHDRGFPRLCSPPLKHITPQTTQDLLENFDPFDVLDSASERSTSSADTMIMMTTEEENKNAQRIRNSLLHYESNKSVLRSKPSPSSSLPLQPYSRVTLAQPSYSGKSCDSGIPRGKEDFPKRRNVPNNLLVSCQPRVTDFDKQFHCDKPSPLDDGYGTDSRSNTSASTSSPLSSSFSSLSTFEGSFGSNTSTGIPRLPSPNTPTSPNANMSRHAIIKGQPLPSGLKNSGGPRPVLLAAKKREPSPSEIKDNSPNLEDRLRALTTIEEEEFGTSVGHGKYFSEKHLSSKTVQNLSPRSNTQNRAIFNIPVAEDRQSANNDFKLTDHDGSNSSGFFRAVPIEIVASPTSENRDALAKKDGNNSVPRGDLHLSDAPFALTSFPSPSHERKDGWGDYTRYFEKNSDIPIHNIASTGHGKFVKPGVSDNMPDKDINRKIGSRSVTPSKRPSNEHTQNIHQGVSELNLTGQSLSGNFRPAEIGRMQSDQTARPLTLDQKGIHPHSHTSLPDHRPQNSQWPNENRPLSLPITSEHNSHHFTQAPHYDQGPRSLPPRSQPFNHSQNSNQYFYQDQSSESENHHHNVQVSSPERTSHDEFLSLSRSLSKQNMQLREMLQQEQQPQHQRYHQPPQSHHDQRPATHFPSPQNSTPSYSQNYPEVVLRNSALSSSMRSLSNRHDRYSWQAGNQAYPQDWGDASFMPESAPHHRTSLDLGSIPQLQRQIRATSEMCLQMSKRHVFASSADIYKLFQGQRKPDNRQSASATHNDQFGSNSSSSSTNNNNGRGQFHRHSFHSTSTRPSWASSQSELEGQNLQIDPLKSSLASVRPSLRVPSPAMSTSSRISNSGPIRVDHSITIPPNVRLGGPFDISGHVTDVIDNQKFQRQSSGYSSENELQQIESDAKASRKVRVRDPRATVAINPEQEFRPVKPSSDCGSSTTAVDDEGSSITDNEPVYVNQRMLVNAGVLDDLENPWSSTQLATSTSTPPLPPKNMPIHSVSNASTRPSSVSHGNQQHQHPRQNSHHHHQQQQQQQQQQPVYTRIQPQSERQYLSQGHPYTDESLASRLTSMEGLTQRQVINFNSKPVTITSIIPANSYSPVNASNHDNINNSSAANGRNNNSNNRDSKRPLSIMTQASDKSRDTTNEINISHQASDNSRPYRPDSSSSLQLSPVEIAQILDVPFETNIISDENGDRLSTLV